MKRTPRRAAWPWCAAVALHVALPAQYFGEGPTVTRPPTTTATFGAAAFGGGVTDVAQLQLTPLRTAAGSILRNQWYLCATVKTAGRLFYQGWTGTYVPGRTPEIVANTDVAALNNPTLDMFSFNVTEDLTTIVFDTGASTPPAVARRATPVGPFANAVSLNGIPPGYHDVTVARAAAGGLVICVYWTENMTCYCRCFTETTGNPVGSAVTIVSSTVAAVHSPGLLRQWTGAASQHGTARALIYSHNTNSADAWFRSSLTDVQLNPARGFPVYSSANWKANPTHIGGTLYYAHATTAYTDPLQIDTVCMSSVDLPQSGGAVTLVAWAPRTTTAQFGAVVIGTLGARGTPLPGITGRLGLNLAPMVFLPAQMFDPVYGEISYSAVAGPLPRGSIDMQVVCVDNQSIVLGNTAQIVIR